MQQPTPKSKSHSRSHLRLVTGSETETDLRIRAVVDPSVDTDHRHGETVGSGGRVPPGPSKVTPLRSRRNRRAPDVSIWHPAGADLHSHHPLVQHGPASPPPQPPRSSPAPPAPTDARLECEEPESEHEQPEPAPPPAPPGRAFPSEASGASPEVYIFQAPSEAIFQVPAATVPPSTGIVEPFTKLARSEARKQITAAHSSTEPIR